MHDIWRGILTISFLSRCRDELFKVKELQVEKLYTAPVSAFNQPVSRIS